MPRTSKFHHLRPIVLQLLEAGTPVASLVHEFPQVPKSTLHDWAKAFKRERNTQNPDSAQPPPSSPDYSTIELDFLFAIKVLREIAGDDTAPQAVRVQAAVGLLRAAEMKQKSPAIAMNPHQKLSIDITLHERRERLKGLAGPELRRAYLEAIEGDSDDT
jgi:hypothetical protein